MDTNLDLKKSIIVILIIFFGTIVLSVLGLYIWDAVAKVEKVEEPKSTIEPYKMYMEWNKVIFEEYGLEDVNAPSDTFYQYCENGETYAYGEFYTDDIQKFYYFFNNIYKQIWGRINNIESLFTVEDNVHKFEEKSVLLGKGGMIEEGEESELDHMLLTFTYDTVENKVTFKVKKLDKDSSNNKKEKK